MPRAQGVVPSKARKKKTLKAAKGGFGGRSRLLRTAKENVLRGMQYAYRDRRVRKRQMRRLWIQRINAAVRMHGLSYSQLISGMKKGEILIDRKQLSEMAIHDAEAFRRVVEEARAHLAASPSAPTSA
ncbi:MAG: 50S ribosomal protein L20 [Candidatus Eisenbacteria bacterium]|nr:50S ribosomal protein L20 [Candidatus Eisenbacteria bacterium]